MQIFSATSVRYFSSTCSQNIQKKIASIFPIKTVKIIFCAGLAAHSPINPKFTNSEIHKAFNPRYPMFPPSKTPEKGNPKARARNCGLSLLSRPALPRGLIYTITFLQAILKCLSRGRRVLFLKARAALGLKAFLSVGDRSDFKARKIVRPISSLEHMPTSFFVLLLFSLHAPRGYAGFVAIYFKRLSREHLPPPRLFLSVRDRIIFICSTLIIAIVSVMALVC